MERLTKWLNDKTAICIKECEKECVEGYTECHKCKPFKDVMKKLADYEDAEEQGLLLRLPCPIGTTVYVIDSECEGDPYDCYHCCDSCGCLNKFVDEVKFDVEFIDCIGKDVFLTREEAEQELANRQQSHAEAIMDERNGR